MTFTLGHITMLLVLANVQLSFHLTHLPSDNTLGLVGGLFGALAITAHGVIAKTGS